MISLFVREERDTKRQRLNDPLALSARHIDLAAIAAKNARMSWAVLHHASTFPVHAVPASVSRQRAGLLPFGTRIGSFQSAGVAESFTAGARRRISPSGVLRVIISGADRRCLESPKARLSAARSIMPSV